MSSIAYNTDISLIPHREGMWKEQGIIKGLTKQQPPLFKQSGATLFTWKDDYETAVTQKSPRKA